MAQPSIQTSFASGEWAPKLQSRVDAAKYKAGASLLRNFFVDFSGGGASTRQGTKFLGQVGANGARLVRFQPSTTLSYVLEFGQNYIRFYTNGAQVLNLGSPYQISSPYAASDLFPNQATGNPGIKFVQDVTSLIICHPNYPPYILTLLTATNWTLNSINFGPTISSPTGLAVSTTESAGSYNYAYSVTAVDNNGQESPLPTAVTLSSINAVEQTAGANTLSWTGVNGAVSYNVYKSVATYGAAVPSGTVLGFIGNTQGTTFIDSYPGLSPDFSQTPPIQNNPFQGGSVTGATVTAAGSYSTVPTVSFAAPASGYRARGYVWLSILTATPSSLVLNNPNNHNLVGEQINMTVDGIVLTIASATLLTGTHYTINTVTIAYNGALYSGSAPATDTPFDFSDNSLSYVSGNVGYTWGVGGVGINSGGYGYTTNPAITFSAGAATAVSMISVAGNPGVPSLWQERLCLAGQVDSPQAFNLSQPGSFFNFNYTNPSEPDDSITGTIVSEDLNDIRSLVPVPTGLAAFTGMGAWIISGGSGFSISNPITPSTASASPQAFNGANDLKPVKIGLDLLFATNKGNYVRDFTYNIYANVFTGNDISVLSNHLFFGYNLLDWAWSEEPFKTLWAIRNDGTMLSLAYVKEQELAGWAHHDTNGQFLSVCSVIENVNGNIVDAVYVIVQRFINGSYVQYVERMADRYFPYGYEDSWSVDCGLQTTPQASPTTTLTITGSAASVGNSVTLSDTAGAPFTSGMASGNWIVRAGGGIYKITVFGSSSSVTATVVQVPSFINQYSGTPFPVTGYAIWQPVTSVSGLTQLENAAVVGVADGVAISGTVSNTGTFTLASAASKITIGLAYLPQLKTLPLDLGEPTIQGKRKKIPAVTLRVADTLGLQVGTTFANAVTMKDFILGNVGTQSNQVVTGLVDGDGRTILDQVWQEPGTLCIQQNLPYPATILGVMPETTVGDTR